MAVWSMPEQQVWGKAVSAAENLFTLSLRKLELQSVECRGSHTDVGVDMEQH